jgi:acyl phosphate:glycerol-3-phosphate acyltransferase
VGFEFGTMIAAGYLLGSVPTSYLAARWSRGIDIREYGSGNVGASNLLSATSKRVAAPVFLFDLLKGWLTVWVAWRLGMGITEQMVVGLATIGGHNWPVFLRFRGGRGVVTTMGVALIVPLLNNLVSWGAVILITVILNAVVWVSSFFKQGSLGVFIAAAGLPLVSWIFAASLPFTLGCFGMFLMLVIRRLTAPQPVTSSSLSRSQVLVNRLLFDRDIRERSVWMSRVQAQEEKQKRPAGNNKQ